MPAESIAQRRFMGACEHGAGWANCPKMTHAQFHDFAATKEKGLPMRVKKSVGGVMDDVMPKGMLQYGNIDLNKRPIVYQGNNPSTELSFSFRDNQGNEVLIPRVVGGKILSEKDAKDHYFNTGEHMGIFDSPENADAYAQKVHSRVIPPLRQFASGGMMDNDYTGGTDSAQLDGATPLPKSAYGTDVIPSALTPNEMVLTPKQQGAVMPKPGKAHLLLPSQLRKLHSTFKLPKPGFPGFKTPRMRFQFGGVEPPELQDPTSPDNQIPSTVASGADRQDLGLDPRMANFLMSVISSNPWLINNMTAPQGYQPPPGLPGSSQGPTMIPAYFDTQGYPWAEPVTSDYNTAGGSRHIPPKKPS